MPAYESQAHAQAQAQVQGEDYCDKVYREMKEYQARRAQEAEEKVF